jgi:hypothetical protein
MKYYMLFIIDNMYWFENDNNTFTKKEKWVIYTCKKYKYLRWITYICNGNILA